MWHKQEVYVDIRHSFNLAWREFVQSGKAPEGMGEDAAWHKYKEKIADEVVSHARIPSSGSSRAMKDYAMKPWKIPHYTRDDGVRDLGVERIKRIILDWLNQSVKGKE